MTKSAGRPPALLGSPVTGPPSALSDSPRRVPRLRFAYPAASRWQVVPACFRDVTEVAGFFGRGGEGRGAAGGEGPLLAPPPPPAPRGDPRRGGGRGRGGVG